MKNARVNRRQALAGIGSVSLGALIAACGGDDDGGSSAQVETTEGTTSTVEPSGGQGGLAGRFDDASVCTRTAEQTEGPFYFDVDSIRSDIRDDRDGAKLRLGVRVRDAAECRPLADAVVDIWHCDAAGAYSAFGEEEGETYLRGAQVTNADGIAEFTTIYPGWYPGRTVHIHAKVHLDKQTVLTTQLYFGDDFTTRCSRPSRTRPRGARHAQSADGIYDESVELTLSEEGGGYLGLITLDVA